MIQPQRSESQKQGPNICSRPSLPRNRNSQQLLLTEQHNKKRGKKSREIRADSPFISLSAAARSVGLAKLTNP